MSRPKGSLNKTKSFAEATKEIVANMNNALSKVNSEDLEAQRSDYKAIRYDLNLSVRAFRNGRFKGLWELSKLHNDGKREILIDATSRQSMINMMNRQVMKMVIAA